MEQQLELLILEDLDPYPPNPTRQASPPPNVRRATNLTRSRTEAVNGTIELHRRLARGFRNRDNYRLRMLLAAGGLTS